MNNQIRNKGISYGLALFLLLSGVFSIYAYAQSEKVEAVTIPPPLEGIKKPPHSNQHQQDLEKTDIEIYTSGNKTYPFSVEVAITKDQQNKGLMFRDKIETNTGMLFIFEESRERAFWMKNTFISLDIIFIRDDGVIHSISPRADPKSLKRISSNGKIKAVLEIGGGEAKRLGISIGDRVIYDALQDDSSE